MLAAVRLLTPQTGQECGLVQPKSVTTRTIRSARLNRVPAMRRLLSPVNVGVSAARHVLWYLSYHAAPRQRL